MNNATMTETDRLNLVNVANAQTAQWPQYRGHFDAYRIGRITRDVKTKLGLAFRKGDVVIWTIGERDLGNGPEVTFTAWSVRNRCDTGVTRSCLEVR